MNTLQAAVAALFRASPLTGHCELLYIKRKARDNDRWGGQWAFPGGKQDPGESLEQTCVREVHEEIGLDISDAGAWLPLGWVGRQNTGGASGFDVHMAAYLFLSQGTAADLDALRIRLQPGEVSAAVWIPTSFFAAADTRLRPFPMHKWGLDFPSVYLPVPDGIPIEHAHIPLWGLSLRFTELLFRHFDVRLPVFDEWPSDDFRPMSTNEGEQR